VTPTHPRCLIYCPVLVSPGATAAVRPVHALQQQICQSPIPRFPNIQSNLLLFEKRRRPDRRRHGGTSRRPKLTPRSAGAANIADKGTAATTRKDQDIVPDAAVRPSQDVAAHTGRGGAGNSVKPADAVKEEYQGLAEKIRTKLRKLLKK
jgi:hypothetical protein